MFRNVGGIVAKYSPVSVTHTMFLSKADSDLNESGGRLSDGFGQGLLGKLNEFQMLWGWGREWGGGGG